MHIEIRQQTFNPYEELQQYQAVRGSSGKYGATASFVGTMRDFNEGDAVKGMTLEYYPGMTEKQVEKICQTAVSRWSVIDSLVIHRVGVMEIGEPIVLVGVWSAHRGDAFDACRYIMEELKHNAPFWKKEQLEAGERWVEKNTDGYSANSHSNSLK